MKKRCVSNIHTNVSIAMQDATSETLGVGRQAVGARHRHNDVTSLKFLLREVTSTRLPKLGVKSALGHIHFAAQLSAQANTSFVARRLGARPSLFLRW
jgi:hypothetical protein